MTKLQESDFSQVGYWTLYVLRDELPNGISIENEEEFLQLPDAVKLAVAHNFNFAPPGAVKTTDLPSQYNWMIFCLDEFLNEHNVTPF